MPDRWKVVFSTLAIEVVAWGILMSVPRVLGPVWIEQFSASRSAVVLPTFLAQIVSACAAPLLGIALVFWAPRRFQIAAAALVAATLVACILATDMAQIDLLFATLGAAALICSGPMLSQTLIRNWFPNNRGTAVGVVSTGPGLGQVLISPLVAGLAVSVGVRPGLAILALIAVLVIPIFALRYSRLPAGDVAAIGRPQSPGNAARRPASGGMLMPLHRLDFWANILIVTPMFALWMALTDNASLYLADRGLSLIEIGWANSSFGIAAIVSAAALAWLADRRVVPACFLMAGGAAIALLALTLHLSPPIAVAAIFTAILFSGGAMSVQYIILGDRFAGSGFPMALGLATPINTAALIGSVAAAFLRDNVGSYELGFSFYLICPALTAGGALMLHIIEAQPSAPTCFGAKGVQ
jgi:MFS family permease